MTSGGIRAVHGFVSGRVQGVGFRYSAVRAAQSCNVHGWVRNTMDGRVEVFAQGAPDGISRMVAWLKKGPPTAMVESFEYGFTAAQSNIRSFRITY